MIPSYRNGRKNTEHIFKSMYIMYSFFHCCHNKFPPISQLKLHKFITLLSLSPGQKSDKSLNWAKTMACKCKTSCSPKAFIQMSQRSEADLNRAQHHQSQCKSTFTSVWHFLQCHFQIIIFWINFRTIKGPVVLRRKIIVMSDSLRPQVHSIMLILWTRSLVSWNKNLQPPTNQPLHLRS